MTDKKKTWTEPELIVIVRGKPEEAILAVCKYPGVPDGSSVTFVACSTSSEPCLQCASPAAS